MMAKQKAADFSALNHYRLDQIRVTDRELGRGSYATVLELEYMGLKCAGKKIHDMLLTQPGKDITYTVRKFEEECRILSQVRHPNIVQFLGVYFQSQKDQIPILVMEFLPINLSSCIERYVILPKESSFSILHDVALGLCYLHSQTPAIIHRDLSSNNVLLTSNMTAKISDLGVARILNLEPTKSSNMTSAPGTPVYMPPEVMKPNPKYNTNMDTFSYGVLMIHVLSGSLPVPQVEPVKVAKGGKLVPVTEVERRAQFLQVIGNNHPLMDIILKCINNDPQQRPQSSEIVERLAEMVSQFPASFANRLEMLKHFQIDEEEKKLLRERVGDEFMLREEMSLEVKQLQLLVENLKAENSRQTTINSMLREELANKDTIISAKEAIISAKEEIIAATATTVLGKESEIQSQSVALEQKEAIISGMSQQLTKAREYLATKQQVLSAGINWETCADLPTEFNGGHSVIINGEVFFGGGNTDEKHDYNEYIVHRYKPSLDKWTTLSPLPVRWFGLGQINGKLVAIGGVRAKDKKPTSEVYTYDEKSVQMWKQTLIPQMQTARVSPGVFSIESLHALIVAGGEVKQNSYTNAVEIFKPPMSQWYETDPLPTACCEMSTVSIGNTCYLLGGYKYPSNLKQALCVSVEDLFHEIESTEERDHTTRGRSSSTAWKTLLDTPVYIPAVAMLSGKLLAIGGDKTIEGGARTKKVYMYSPSADSWIYISDLLAPRSMTTVANLSSTEILVIGGEYGGNRMKTVYKGTLTMKV